MSITIVNNKKNEAHRKFYNHIWNENILVRKTMLYYTLNGSDNWNYSWISKLSCSTCIEQCCKLMAGNWTTNLRRLLEMSSSLGYRLWMSMIIIRILLFCKLLASSGNESTFWHPWIALKQLRIMNHNVNC